LTGGVHHDIISLKERVFDKRQYKQLHK